MSTAIYNLLKLPESFKNPFDNHITTLSSTIAINNLTASVSSVYQSLTLENQNLAASNMLALANQSERFLSHTNRLTGKNLTLQPNIAQLASLSKMVKNIDGVLDCALHNDIFGSLVDSSNIMKAYDETLSEISRMIAIGDNIVQFLNSIQGLINNLSSSITRDLNAFVQAQEKAALNAVAAALSSMAGDLCMTGIMNQVMRGELLKEMESIANKKIARLDSLNNLKDTALNNLNSKIEIKKPNITFGKH